MSKSSSMSAYEIRLEGWKALTERLGPAGAMRFMAQYDPGRGTTRKSDTKSSRTWSLKICSRRSAHSNRVTRDHCPTINGHCVIVRSGAILHA
jgi:hypothetical protein